MALWLSASSAAEPMRFVHARMVGDMDSRAEFAWQVLDAALQRTVGRYGPFSLSEYEEVVSPARRRQMVVSGEGPINVAVVPPGALGTDRMVPVRVPIMRGLLGYRVLLIRAEDQARFDAINSFADLSSVKFGSGEVWADTRILREAGLTVVGGEDFDGLFKMLRSGRFDAFGRGVTEAADDLARIGESDIVLERHLLLHYPHPVYFWFSPTAEGRKHAARVLAGMRALKADGTLNRLVAQHFGKTLEILAGRHVIEIANPLLGPGDPRPNDPVWYPTPPR